MTPDGRFRFIDLFAGIGGFHHALGDPAFGGECMLAVEIDEACRQVYRAAFPDTPLVGDIRSITRLPDGRDAPSSSIDTLVPDHDVLCAGFPCQPFSKSGAQQGILDQTRGTLFYDIMAIVRAKRPRFLVLENVPNLVGPNHRDTWRVIMQALRDAGYGVSEKPVILSPHRIPPPLGTPQVRDRVLILARRLDGAPWFDGGPLLGKRPDPSWDPSNWSLAKYLDPDDADAYGLRDIELTWLNAWEAFVRGVEADRLPGFPIWVDAWLPDPIIPDGTPPWKAAFLRKNSAFYVANREFLDSWLQEVWGPSGLTVEDFPLSRRKFEWQARAVHPIRAGRTIWDLLIQLRPSGVRVKPATYVPALVAITQTSVIGERRRRLTPREASKLQGIPFEPFVDSSTPDSAIYAQLGNAVNVGVIKLAASTLFQDGGEDWGRSIQQEMLRLIA